MKDRSDARDAKSGLEQAGETAGRMAGKAADFGVQLGGALFDSAAELLGGWWSSDDARRAADSWSDDAERTCRTHYRSNAKGGTSSKSPEADAAEGLGESGRVAPKSTRAAMQAGDGSPGLEAEAASDGFERARPGYHLGWMARQNPAYSNRGFGEVEPELKRIWEARARGIERASDWNDVRGFVDFAYQGE